jgi:hypothetical protein
MGCSFKSLLILNFPAKVTDDWLYERFTAMGYEVESVRGKSIGRNTQLPLGKSIFAFVNFKSSSSALSMKRACENGMVKLSDSKGKVWTVKAEWANQHHGQEPQGHFVVSSS